MIALGWLRELSTGEAQFETFEGNWFDITGAEGIPINVPIALEIENNIAESYVNIDGPAMDAADPAYKRVAFFAAQDLSDQDKHDFNKNMLERVQQFAAVNERFWKYCCPEWNVKCEGFIFFTDMSDPKASPHPPTYCSGPIQDFIASGGCGDFVPNYHQVYAGRGGYCGIAHVGGKYSAVMRQSGCSFKTSVHEVGHNFGLRHAQQDDLEYGDLSSVMGSHRVANKTRPIHALERHMLGVEQDREKIFVRADRELMLAPVELPKEVLRHGEFQIAVINQQYYLSLRKVEQGVPEQFELPEDPQTLYVHEISETSHYGSKTNRLADIEVGGTWTSLYGTKVKYLEYDRETALIKVTHASG